MQQPATFNLCCVGFNIDLMLGLFPGLLFWQSSRKIQASDFGVFVVALRKLLLIPSHAKVPKKIDLN